MQITTDSSSRTVCLLVFNPFTHDSRVLNIGRTFAANGDVVDVIAVLTDGVPAEEAVGSIQVHRFRFDPLYRRLWVNRSRLARPWRHRREIWDWLKAETGAGRRRGRWALVAAFVLATAPWVTITTLYQVTAKSGRRLLMRSGRQPPWSLAHWIGQRYYQVLYAAPNAIKVATWSGQVMAGFRRGSLRRADIWHANDLETLPLALVLRWAYGGRVVYDSHEIFIEMPGPSKMGPLRRGLLRWAESAMARASDDIVTVNEPIADLLAARWGIHRPLLIVRSCPPLWLPRQGFQSPLRPALRNSGLAEEPRIVLFHGNLQVDRGIEQLVRAAAELPEVALVFLGAGPLRQWLDEVAAHDEWQGRLFLLSPVPPEDLLAWVAGADVSACLIQPTSVNHRLTSPNRLFQAIAAGVPLIATELGPIGQTVEHYRVGITVDPTNPDEIANGLRQLLSLPTEEAAEVRRNARRAHESELNWEHEALILEALYERLAPRLGGRSGMQRSP